MAIFNFRKAVFIKAVGLTHEALEPISVHGPLKRALGHRNKHLGWGTGKRRRGQPGQAQRVHPERRILPIKKLLDALFAAQVLLFWKRIASVSC